MFCNNNNNNPPVRITVQEATEQKLNILLEWPNNHQLYIPSLLSTQINLCYVELVTGNVVYSNLQTLKAQTLIDIHLLQITCTLVCGWIKDAA